MSHSHSLSPLRKLVDILSAAVQIIDDRYAAASLEFPSLDKPLDPSSEAESLLTSDPYLSGAISDIVAATGQLSASVEYPAVAIISAALSFHVSAGLATASCTNLVEILREAGPAGLHINEIAKKSGSHPTKTGRLLRLLCTHHIFREIAPDVFANNRLSSVMDTMKSSKDLFETPHKKHEGTPGISAFVHHCNDSFKSAAYLPEDFTDPKYSHSEALTETPFNMAFNTKLSYWDWLEQPENQFRRATFGAAMDGTTKLEVPDAILKGFHWDSLPARAVVVDVGGGIGSTSFTICTAHPDFRLVLQDLPGVIDNAKTYWQKKLPPTSSREISFQGHNFFDPQPVIDASVYFLRGVLHDWNDSQATEILRHLRNSATSRTQLLIVEQVLRYACEDTTLANVIIPGAARPTPRTPLLANHGQTSRLTYLLDLQMLNMCNGRERTLAEFMTITSKAGWKIVRVFHIQGSPLSHLVAEPVNR